MGDITWKGKYFVIDNKRNVDDEMITLGLEMEDIIVMLENGKDIRKRGKRKVEKWFQKGMYIYIVAIEDCDDYWLIRHVGRIKASKKKLKLLRR